jgi:hypothetical protein
MKTWLLLILLACHGSDTPPRQGSAAGSARHHGSVVDDETQRALVLDAALKKLEGEITQLEASPTRDEAELARKKEEREALRLTLANIQRRLDERSGSGRSSN